VLALFGSGHRPATADLAAPALDDAFATF